MRHKSRKLKIKEFIYFLCIFQVAYSIKTINKLLYATHWIFHQRGSLVEYYQFFDFSRNNSEFSSRFFGDYGT